MLLLTASTLLPDRAAPLRTLLMANEGSCLLLVTRLPDLRLSACQVV